MSTKAERRQRKRDYLAEMARAMEAVGGDPQQYSVTQSCFLCEEPSVYMGFFIPNERHTAAYGAIAGKSKTFIHGLCEACRALPDRDSRIEERFFAVIPQQTKGAVQ